MSCANKPTENEGRNAGDYVMPDKAKGKKEEIHFHNYWPKMMGAGADLRGGGPGVRPP